METALRPEAGGDLEMGVSISGNVAQQQSSDETEKVEENLMAYSHAFAFPTPGWPARVCEACGKHMKEKCENPECRPRVMVKHIIDGHEVLLPSDAILNPGDDLPGTY